MKDRGTAEDALWRLRAAAKKYKGARKKVTQKDFDDTWSRAEGLEERGEVRKASRMFEAARKMMSLIKSTKVSSLSEAM